MILFPIKKMDSVCIDSIKEHFLHINSNFNKFILKKAEQIYKIRDDAIKTKQDKENMTNKIFSALNEIDASDNNFLIEENGGENDKEDKSKKEDYNAQEDIIYNKLANISAKIQSLKKQLENAKKIKENEISEKSIIIKNIQTEKDEIQKELEETKENLQKSNSINNELEAKIGCYEKQNDKKTRILTNIKFTFLGFLICVFGILFKEYFYN